MTVLDVRACAVRGEGVAVQLTPSMNGKYITQNKRRGLLAVHAT